MVIDTYICTNLENTTPNILHKYIFSPLIYII